MARFVAYHALRPPNIFWVVSVRLQPLRFKNHVVGAERKIRGQKQRLRRNHAAGLWRKVCLSRQRTLISRFARRRAVEPLAAEHTSIVSCMRLPH